MVTASPETATYPNDYLQQEVTTQFNPGQSDATVYFSIVADNNIQEGDETFHLALTIVSDFGTVDPNYDEATVTIVDSRSTYFMDLYLTSEQKKKRFL